MPFHLTDGELQNAFEAIEYHGYSGLVPLPLEWETVRNNWLEIKHGIMTIDLDDYMPTAPMVLFSPKSRATVRPVCLLHPIDLLIYSALTLIVKDDIESERISVRSHRVFSYRIDSNIPNRFYSSDVTYSDFREEARQKSMRAGTRFVAVADIADFFPRIYQHRLENAIEASAKAPRGRDVARVLVRKILAKLFSRNSYGIPVGPFASRVLAEAVLIDVDSALLSHGADFVRWVDDYYIFCRTEVEAQSILFRLAEQLFGNHGLTLSGVKTKILSSQNFQEQILGNPEEEVQDEFFRLVEITGRINPYAEDEIELTNEEIQDLEGLNLNEVLRAALADHSLVDYERVKVVLAHPSILRRLSQERRESIATILLDNMEHLYPVAEEVSAFFQTFSDSPKRERNRISVALLRSIRSFRGKWPPEYQMVWVLSVFAASENWGGAREILSIFVTHPSTVVRRYAALALYKNGSRSDAVVLRNEFGNSSPLTQLAILLATHKLGVDERRHWRRTVQLSGILESIL